MKKLSRRELLSVTFVGVSISYLGSAKFIFAKKEKNEQRIIMRGLSLNQAEKILQACKSLISKEQLPPMTVVVLDNGGILKAAFSEDGSGTLRYKIAFGKANGALGMGFDSSQFHNYLEKGVLSSSFAQAINGVSGGDFIPVPGGCLILNDTRSIIGAIGVSGASSNIDEKIAKEAIRLSGLGSYS